MPFPQLADAPPWDPSQLTPEQRAQLLTIAGNQNAGVPASFPPPAPAQGPVASVPPPPPPGTHSSPTGGIGLGAPTGQAARDLALEHAYNSGPPEPPEAPVGSPMPAGPPAVNEPGGRLYPTPRLTAPPAPSGAPGAPGGGPDARDAALASLVSPRSAAGGPAHAVGLSKADKEYLGQLREQAASTEQTTREAVEQNKSAAEAFGEQSSALADDSRIGVLTFQQQSQENAKKRQDLDAQVADNQKKIDAHLAELEGKGIDPNRYWNSMSTGQRIGTSIALALGAGGAALTHTNNDALEMINSAISRDVDAQKTNLSKSLELLKTRMDSNKTSFDQHRALLEAERDSIQTAFTVVSNDVSKRAAMYGQNAEVQQKAAQLNQGLQASRAAQLSTINERLYALNKGAERVVGGGGGGDAKIREAIVKRSQDLADKAREAGHEISPAEARRVAASEILGVDIKPGEPMPSMAKPQKGAGSGKAGEQLASIDSAIANIDEMKRLRSGAGLIRGSEDNSRGEGLSLATRTLIDKGLGGRMSPELLAQFQKMVPEDPLEHNVSGILGADPTMARLDTAKQILLRHRANVAANPSAPAADDNPSGLTADE